MECTKGVDDGRGGCSRDLQLPKWGNEAEGETEQGADEADETDDDGEVSG